VPPLKRVSIGGYRAAHELDFEPRSVCALVGEASSGKSTVLTAIWTLFEAAAPPVLFLPANLRSRSLVAPATGAAADAAQLLQPPLAAHHWAKADGGLQLVMGMERLLASSLRRFVLLIEDPELYLSPHAQRHLFRLLRSLAKHGNQILYSTHAPVFLSVDRLEELALVRHHPNRGTTLFQPEALEEAEAFRQILAIAGRRRTVVLAPDFEAVSGVSVRSRGRKPRKAYRRYSGNGEVPPELRLAIETLLKAAQD
jgi:hypothetical protein